MDYESLLNLIKNGGSEEKKVFTERIVKTKSEVLSGAPVPFLVSLSKSMLKEGHSYKDYVFGQYYEIDFLIGLLIVNQKTSIEEKYNLLEQYMANVDNWALVDMISSRFKVKDYQYAKRKVLAYIVSSNVYLRRFGYIHFLTNFIKDENALIDILPFIKNDEEYIVQMAIAWLLATAFVYHQQVMKKYFYEATLSYDIKKMTVQKLRDSKRITDDLKEELKEYIRNLLLKKQ